MVAFFKSEKAKQKTIFLVLLFAMLFGSCFYGYTAWANRLNAVAVSVDEKEIAYVSEEAVAEEALEKVLEDKKKHGLPVRIDNNIEYTKVHADDEDLCTSEELVKIFADNLDFLYGAVGIEIDGDVQAVLKSKEDAENVIEKLKEEYLPNTKETEDSDIKVKDVRIKQNIEYTEVETTLDEILNIEEALSLLKTGQENQFVHEVKEGDSLWSIARKYNTRVSDIREINPEIEGDRLSLGQKINLKKAEPLVDVEVSWEKSVTQTIPYEVEFTESKELYKGQERVTQWGASGERCVTYDVLSVNGKTMICNKVAEEIIKEPINKVIAKGIKKKPVSSVSRGGTGKLIWPLRGPINSNYGYRGREFHTGMDIGSPRGTPIVAADSGKVIFAGWKGNYGKCVIINHGGGMRTLYAHCSKLYVKAGDSVKRGQTIAGVGSTGRSTGSHLHFEVLVNGKHTNPKRYLR